MALESRLLEGDCTIEMHSIFFPITNVLKSSVHCGEDYDLETVIRPNIQIELKGFKFSVMPLVVICSNFTGDAIVAKHAELTVDDCKFNFPSNIVLFQNEIKDLIKKPKNSNALSRFVHQNLSLFRFDEQNNLDVYHGLVNLITPTISQKIKLVHNMEKSDGKRKRKTVIDTDGLYKIAILKRFFRGIRINTVYYGRVEFGSFYTKDKRIFCANKLDDESYILCSINNIEASELEFAHLSHFGTKFKRQ